MLLTRIWSVILAVLAVGCLAGMFLLSAGSSGDFTDADKAAIQAVTEAGVAAIEAEIQGSSVQQATLATFDPRLQKALERTDGTPTEELPEDELPLEQILIEVAEDLRVRTDSGKLTLAVIEKTGVISAVNGVAESNMGELVSSDAFKAVPPTEDALFSIILGSEIYVAKITAAAQSGRRLVAVDTLRVGAGSLLRRVLGSQTPAALVRKGTVVGEMIGDLDVSAEIEALAREHGEDVSDQGASRVFTVGEGLGARIGCLGRVPGPAGAGKSGAMLAVLSRHTAAAGKRDLAEALGDARDRGLLSGGTWGLLIGLFIVSAGLAIYLPQLEAVAPLRRLGNELQGVSQGTQHQIFHDRYSGTPGELARAAAGAVDALRQAFLAELEIEDDASDDPEGQRRARTNRQRRLTRAHQKLSEKRGPSGPQLQTGRRQRRTGSRPEAAIVPTTPPSSEWVETPEPANPTEQVRPFGTEPPLPGRDELPAGPITEPAPVMRPADHGLPTITPGRPTTAPPMASTPTPPVSTASTAPPPAEFGPPGRGGTFSPPARAAQSSTFGKPYAPPPASATVPAPPPLKPPTPAPARHATPVVNTPISRPPTGVPSPTSMPSPPRPGATVPAPSAASDDPKEAAYHDIFEEFLQVKAACGEPTENLTFDRFAAKLRKNERDLKKNRPDIRDVEFTVYVKDGKAALKAKVVK